MRTRYVVLLLVLCGVGLADAKRVRFIQPRASVVLSGPYGVVIPVQTYVPRDERNRVWVLTWDGEGCGGSSMHTLMGDEDSAIQPESPISVRVTPGLCVFAVAILGAGGVTLTRAELPVQVCGGEADCGG